MGSSLAISTRIGVAVLISLVLITAAITAFMISDPRSAMTRISEPLPTASPSGASSPDGVTSAGSRLP